MVPRQQPAGHRLVYQRRHHPDRVLMRAGDVDQPGTVGADLFAQLEPGAEILGRFIAPGDRAQQILVIKDPHRVRIHAHREIIAVLVNVGGAVAAAVEESQPPGHACEFRAGVGGSGLVHPAGVGRDSPRQLRDVGLVGGVEAHEVRHRARGELRTEPLPVNPARHGELLDAHVGMERHVVSGHEVEGLAQAGFELPVHKTDHHPRRSAVVIGLLPMAQDKNHRRQISGAEQAEGEEHAEAAALHGGNGLSRCASASLTVKARRSFG